MNTLEIMAAIVVGGSVLMFAAELFARLIDRLYDRMAAEERDGAE